MRHFKRFFIAVVTLFCILFFSGWQLSSLAVSPGIMLQMLDRHAEAGLTEHHAHIAVMTTDYLSGKADTFQLEVPEGDQKVPVFHENEQAHMEDVKGLVALGQSLRWAMMGCLVLFGIIFIFNKYGKHFIAPRDVEVGAATGVFLFYGLLIAVAIWSILDFTGAFHAFHRVFFRNDLWLLDPKKDRLIQLMPEPFFVDYTLQFVKRNLAFYASILLAALYFAFGKTKESR